ncbi:MAG TPA: lyase family protein [Mycobacteriales bacterium]|nr:lyase family protein [Mycobacteriales bacterium]
MSVDAGLFSPVRAGTEVEALTSDEAFLQAMLDAEAALARAQARIGLVPADAAAAITAAARVSTVDLVAIARAARDGANPVVPLVPALTAAVRAADPAAAEHVHKGSTSQDILDTGLMLLSARALRVVLRDLTATAGALARLAAEHRDTPAVGRTLTQHAVPLTFGLKAAGWHHLAAVAADRVRALLGTLPVSLGGAAGTLAAYVEHARLHDPAVDPGAFADELVSAYAAETGLAEQVIPWHTLRVPIADLGAVLALVTGALGKFALDVQTLSRTEVAEVVEPAATGRGASSTMPHKRNPVLATMILSAGLQVPAQAAILAQCLVAEDERPAGAWHAEWAPLQACLRLAGGAAETAAELAAGLVVFPAAARRNLDLTGSLVVSERVAAVLAAALGKAEAKTVIGAASATATASGRPLAAVLKDDPQVSEHLSAAEIDALLDPVEYLGVAGHLVDRALRDR